MDFLLSKESLSWPWDGIIGQSKGNTSHPYFDYSHTLVKNGAKVYKQTNFWDCFNLIMLNYLLSWP
jgi:hypothetical protein